MDDMENSVQQNDKMKNRKSMPVIVVIGLFLLIIASVILFISFSGDKTEEETTDVMAEIQEETSESATESLPESQNNPKATLFSNGLLSVLKDGKWGYINESGELVIDYQFDNAGSFSEEGLASVSIEGRYGLIDKTGRFVVNPQYDYISSHFSEGYTYIVEDSKYGFVDKNGKTVIDCYYDYASFFRNGYAIVLFGSVFGVIDKNGQYVINPQYDNLEFAYSEPSEKNIFIARKNGKTGYIDIDGNTVIDFQFDFIMWTDEGIAEFVDDKYAVVSVNDKNGVIDTSGKYLINAVYDSLGYCGNDVFVFCDYDSYKHGLISVDGTIIADAQFDAVYPAGNNLMSVQLGDYFGFIDYSGKYVINPVFDRINGFHNGYAVVEKDDKYSFIDSDGELVVDYQFEHMTDFNSNGYAIVKNNGKYGVINSKGEYVVKCQYDYATEQISAVSYDALYDDFFYVADETKKLKLITPEGEVIMQGLDGLAGSAFIFCNEEGCYHLLGEGTESGYCYDHMTFENEKPAHVISPYYNKSFAAYLKYPSGKTTVYSSCDVVAYGHWISGEEPVTIHEVYTDGCCLVSYITDSGIVRTYYAKISDFVF